MKLTKSQLKQIIKEELEKVLNEAAPAVAGFGQSTVPVRVKKSARAGAGDERFHLSPEQERKLGSGLKPDTPGEVLEEEAGRGSTRSPRKCIFCVAERRRGRR